MGYAEGTRVGVEQSRAEIDRLLGKHGANKRAVMVDEERELAQVSFIVRGHHYRIDVPLPPRAKVADKRPRQWGQWSKEQREGWVSRQWEQQCRERWRAILLMLKAKLEFAQIGVSTVEREFLSDLVLPDGTTMHLAVAKQFHEALSAGTAPMLALPPLTP